MNEKELIERVVSVNLIPRKSKAGNDYQAFVVKFDDGYEFVQPVFGDKAYLLNKYASEL